MPSSQTLQESDLIFSSFSSSLKTTLSELKRTNLSIKNRFRSIKQDSEFVTNVAEAYQLPLIANERCGSWYIPPEHKSGSTYFKSTDGHFGQWAFSLRRLNLQVLEVVGKAGGCIIVDSTRRGKIMPDALSKTVPIWVTVLNRLLWPERPNERLSVPLYAVSESEYAQITTRLDVFVEQAKGLGLDLDELRAKLNGKSMKVTWVKPDETLPETPPIQERRNLIVLCTASNQTSHETSANSEYVQGAADDPESWSLGLDASMFWKNQQMLLEATESDIPVMIENLVRASKSDLMVRKPVLIRPTGNVFIANDHQVQTVGIDDFSVLISCTMQPDMTFSEKLKDKYIVLSCSAGKVGSRRLRKELDQVRDKLKFASGDKVLVTCETGRDLAVGVALALLCLYFTHQGHSRSESDESVMMNKALIKQRLSWIMASMPDASPSRATLQSVNAFLMG